MSKGFITIATGKEEYYILAKNLLESYRYFSKSPLPFAILCDRENEYTELFDNVILFKNGATNSYLDKLDLGEYLPYDETIFIDADCLAYADLNILFDRFANTDDFCCYGRVLPLDDLTGWFEYKYLGELQQRVSYIVGLHGGIYYMRKGQVVKNVFSDAKKLVPDYTKFHFKGKFDTPGDEPLVALSMALNNCHPIPHDLSAICCYWEYVDKMSIDIITGEARIIPEENRKTILVHWGTRYTRELLYQKQEALLHLITIGSGESCSEIKICKRTYDRKIAVAKCKKLLLRVINKIKRTLKP